jgi:hypothetical protein
MDLMCSGKGLNPRTTAERGRGTSSQRHRGYKAPRS